MPLYFGYSLERAVYTHGSYCYVNQVICIGNSLNNGIEFWNTDGQLFGLCTKSTSSESLDNRPIQTRFIGQLGPRLGYDYFTTPVSAVESDYNLQPLQPRRT